MTAALTGTATLEAREVGALPKPRLDALLDGALR